MKKLLLSLACIALMGGAAFAQTTQSLNLYTTGTTSSSGTVTAGSNFSLDTSITFTGFTAQGLSEWLQVNSTLAPYLTITGETYFQFPDPNQAPATGNNTFTSTSGANTNFNSELRDLGASANSAADYAAAGTYTVNTITFTLAANAPAGTYSIQDLVLSPKKTVISDTNFVSHAVSQSTYTLTVAALTAVPEPSTWVAGLGAAGVLGFTILRRRRIA